MRNTVHELDRLLRGELTRQADLQAGRIGISTNRLVLLSVPMAWLFVAAGSRGLNQWLAQMVSQPAVVEEEVRE